MREYLERKLEPRATKKLEAGESSEEWMDRFPESVRRDFAPYLHFEESGTETIKLDSGTLTFSYEPVPEEMLKKYRRHNPSVSEMQDLGIEPENLEKIVAASRFMQMERGRFRRLTRLVIEANGSTVELDGVPIQNILFTVDVELQKSELDRKDVFLYGPPTSPIAILALFHEIGHAEVRRKAGIGKRLGLAASRAIVGFENEANPAVQRQFREDLFENSAEVVLRDERDAWAAALSKLRYVLPALNVSRADVLTSIHEIILSSYSDLIRDRIARRPEKFRKIDSLMD